MGKANWERLFDQLEINAQVAAFIETILNVFQNYVPNKYITIDNKDPVWMNKNIKTRSKKKIHSTKNILKMELKDLKVTLFFLKNYVNDILEVDQWYHEKYGKDTAKKI